MKQLIGKDIGSYVFDKTAKTITFSGVSITQEQILLITNTTTQTIIYSFADDTLGGSLSGLVLTLDYDTSSMSNTDKLQIYIDIPFIYPELDTTTNSQCVIEWSHCEIHEGDHFFYTDYDGDVDTATPKYYRLTTPNTTKWCHIVFILYSEGIGTWQFFENPTVNGAGTTATTFNNNRNSSNTAGLIIAYDPTSTADGTLLKTWRTGAGTNNSTRVGGETSRDVEIILKQNEDYFLKFTPDADNARTKVELIWYEHTNVA